MFSRLTLSLCLLMSFSALNAQNTAENKEMPETAKSQQLSGEMIEALIGHENFVVNEPNRLARKTTTSVQRKPLYEEFTSSTCAPCHLWNGELYTPFFNSVDDSQYSFIAYPVAFPGPGDPYNIPEVAVRRLYYSVNAAPTMMRGGHHLYSSDYYNMNQMQTDLDSARQAPAYFSIDIDAVREGTSLDVTVNTTAYKEGSYVLYVALIENKTTGNVGTNGDTEFENVLMKMLPDGEGTAVDFTEGQSESTSFNEIDLSTTNIEEYNDIQVVAWIQNPSTKRVMQSENTAESGILAVPGHQLKTMAIYPNPSRGKLKIEAQTPVEVSITNTLGQVVFTQSAVTRQNRLDLSGLHSGVYFVNLKNASGQVTKKLILE